MTEKAKQLFDAALELDSDERAVLIARLSDSLHEQIDPAIEQAWVAECDRRWASYQRGETQARPYEEVMRDIKQETDPR